MMEESKAVSTMKMTFKPEIWKIEKYLTEISVPQNFLALQPGESALSPMQFPKGSQKFNYGTLSKTPFPSNIVGSFSRENCLLIIQFWLPENIENKKLTMQPFLVELLAEDKIVADFMQEFPAAMKIFNSALCIYLPYYFTKLHLSPIWKNEIDLIRITWNIHVQESVAGFASDLSDGVKESGHFSGEIASLFNSNDLSDATIRCGTELIPVHRFVLSVASPVFRKMFETEMKEMKNGEVRIEDFDIKVVRLMIKWIYTGNVGEVEIQDQMNLFKACHRYQLETLKNLCIPQICAKISPDNVLAMYVFVETYEEPKILEKVLEIMKANKDKVFGDEATFKEFVLRYPKVMLELFKG